MFQTEITSGLLPFAKHRINVRFVCNFEQFLASQIYHRTNNIFFLEFGEKNLSLYSRVNDHSTVNLFGTFSIFEEILVVWTRKPKLLIRQPSITPGIGGCLGTESHGTVENPRDSPGGHESWAVPTLFVSRGTGTEF